MSSVRLAGEDCYYDLHVPGPENYLAEGLFHHNTGKTFGILGRLHETAMLNRNVSIVICRKRQTDVYSTVLQTYEKKVAKAELDSGLVTIYGGERPSHYDYTTSGSRIWIAGLDQPGKVLSGEHDIIYPNQAEELSLVDWEFLLSRVTGRAGHIEHPQLIGDCNPESPIHWIQGRKRSAVHPERPLAVFDTTHRDNPDLFDQETGEITPEGERRLGRLAKLTGTRLARLYHGLWVTPEGAIFGIFEEETHKIAALAIPAVWPRFVGIDPIGAFVGALWLAYDPKSMVIHTYREYLEPFGAPTRTHANNIMKLSGFGGSNGPGESIFYWVCGQPAERQARADWTAAGIPVVGPAFSDVQSGIDMILELLQQRRLVIHDSCPHLLGQIADYRRKIDTRTGLVTDKIEKKEEYHLIDCLRYAIVGPEPTEQVEVMQLPWSRIV